MVQPFHIKLAKLLLSSHPQGNGKEPLNRGWPLNRGSSEISIRHGILFEYKDSWNHVTTVVHIITSFTNNCHNSSQEESVIWS